MDTTVKDWLFLWARTPTSWEEVGKRQILLFVPFPWSTEVGQCKRHKSNRLGGRGLSFSKETRAPGSTAGKSTEYGRQHQGVWINCTSHAQGLWGFLPHVFHSLRTVPRTGTRHATLDHPDVRGYTRQDWERGAWLTKWLIGSYYNIHFPSESRGTPSFLEYTTLFPLGPSVALWLPGPSRVAAVTP